MAKISTCPNYTSAIVVVHGESEYIIARHIKSSLKLKLHIHKGTTSIQINGLLKELNTYFEDISQLKKNPKLFLDITKNTINNFKIFTIMDTDDCSEETKEKYIDGSLFSKYELKDYVVPIYLTPDLEHVLYNSKLIPKIYNDSEKVKEYGKLFPISNVPIGSSQLPMDNMKATHSLLINNKKTNLDLFIQYCIKQAEMKRVGRSF